MSNNELTKNMECIKNDVLLTAIDSFIGVLDDNYYLPIARKLEMRTQIFKLLKGDKNEKV